MRILHIFFGHSYSILLRGAARRGTSMEDGVDQSIGPECGFSLWWCARCKQAVYIISMVSLGVIYSWNLVCVKLINYACMFDLYRVLAGLENDSDWDWPCVLKNDSQEQELNYIPR